MTALALPRTPGRLCGPAYLLAPKSTARNPIPIHTVSYTNNVRYPHPLRLAHLPNEALVTHGTLFCAAAWGAHHFCHVPQMRCPHRRPRCACAAPSLPSRLQQRAPLPAPHCLLTQPQAQPASHRSRASDTGCWQDSALRTSTVTYIREQTLNAAQRPPPTALTERTCCTHAIWLRGLAERGRLSQNACITARTPRGGLQRRQEPRGLVR